MRNLPVLKKSKGGLGSGSPSSEVGMFIVSSQIRTGVVDLPADLAQAKPQDESAKANKVREAAFRALAKDIAM